MTYSFECASNLHCFHFICVERLCFTCPIISGVAPLAVWPRPVMGNIVAIDRLARTIIRAALIRARKTIRIQPFWICAVVWGGLSGSAPLASVGGGLSPRFQVPVPRFSVPVPRFAFLRPFGAIWRPSSDSSYKKAIQQDPNKIRYPRDLDPLRYPLLPHTTSTYSQIRCNELLKAEVLGRVSKN